MKGFKKTTYWFVQFIYSDYSDFCDTFNIEWKKKDIIEFMKNEEYHERKLEKGLEITEIYINRVSKYTKDMWD